MPRASRCGNDILRRDPSRAAQTLLHVIDGARIDHIEVARTAPGFREGEGKHEEVALRLKHMIGLADGFNVSAIYESALQSSDVHKRPHQTLFSVVDLLRRAMVNEPRTRMRVAWLKNNLRAAAVDLSLMFHDGRPS